MPTTTCASGCAAQLEGLRECLAGLQKPRVADQNREVGVDPFILEAVPEEGPLAAGPLAAEAEAAEAEAAEAEAAEAEALPEEGPLAAEVPRAESPALISRSQSSATNEAETQEMPTLLTSKAETQVPKVCMAGKDLPEKADRDEAEEAENSTVAMTTGNVSEEEGSAHSTPRNRLDCCTAAPALREWDTDDFLNLSARMGQAAWSGSQEAARFLATSLLKAAELAEPHVTSLADSAAGAIRSAAKNALASPPAQEVLSRSTWEATSQRALAHPCGSEAPVFPELADFDPCPSAPQPCQAPAMPRMSAPMSQPPYLPMQPMKQPTFDLARDAQLRYSLPGLKQKSQSFSVPSHPRQTSAAGFGSTHLPTAREPQRMVSASPAYTGCPHGYFPQMLSAPPSFRLSEGPVLAAQPPPVPRLPLSVEGPLVEKRSTDGPTLALASVRPGEPSIGDRRPLARNRIRAEEN